MTTITNNTLTSFASTFLTLEGETSTTVKNLLKHHKNANIASVQCPTDNFTITLNDGTSESVSSAIVYLRLTSASKTALDDLSSWKYGRLVKGIMLPDYATSAYVGTVKTTTKAIKHIISSNSQLITDITSAFNSRIADLKDTLTSAVKPDMLTEYLAVVRNSDLSIDGIYIDARATKQLLHVEAMQEQVEQIESIFSGTRCEFDITIIDNNTVEAQLSNFDYTTIPVMLERLTGFNMSGKFDADKSGILKKLNVQVLTIAL